MRKWLVKFESYSGEVYVEEFSGFDWEHAKSTIPNVKEIYWKKPVEKNSSISQRIPKK